jgi:His-Xaa-Ser system radical SAM maturase HxsC
MLKLHGRNDRCSNSEPFVARIGDPEAAELTLPPQLRYLVPGDIVRVVPRIGEINVLYRKSSPHNTIFTTGRCNSNCIMCSQPPSKDDDSYLVDAWLEAIPRMSPETVALGITGGEPTLLGARFLELLAACRNHLPSTALHVLTNGRGFNYLSLCKEVASLQHPDLMFGVPLYSDLPSQHDFVVQAEHAFDQTIRGIMNMARCGLRVELRVVLHAQTIPRLPQLARFIARNLPMVSHVALMGLETIGYVKMNLPALWIDPFDYQAELTTAVRTLDRAGLATSIYNHQLCVLDRALWPFARKSISDWKNEYFEVCGPCAVREECGGFFSSASLRASDHLRAVGLSEVPLDPGSPGSRG